MFLCKNLDNIINGPQRTVQNKKQRQFMTLSKKIKPKPKPTLTCCFYSRLVKLYPEGFIHFLYRFFLTIKIFYPTLFIWVGPNIPIFELAVNIWLNEYRCVRTIEDVWETCLETVIIIVLVVQNLGTSERLLSNLCWEMDRKSEAEVTGVRGHWPLTVQSASTRNASLLSPAWA